MKILTVLLCMYRMGGEFIDWGIENQDIPILTFDPEEAEEIRSRLCAQLTRTVYHFNNHFLFQDCYDALDPDDQDLYDDPPSHFLCGIAAKTRISHCSMCDINIAELQPAKSCIQCISVYDDLTHLERNFLVQGIVTRTVAR
jgi:hypothetical protein